MADQTNPGRFSSGRSWAHLEPVIASERSNVAREVAVRMLHYRASCIGDPSRWDVYRPVIGTGLDIIANHGSDMLLSYIRARCLAER